MATGNFSGVSYYYIDVDAALSSQDANGWSVYWRTFAVRNGGTTGYQSGANGSNNTRADSNQGGDPDLLNSSGFGYDFRAGVGTQQVFNQGYFYVGVDANGNGSYFVNGAMTLVNLGSASAGTGWRSLPRIGQAPGAPGYPTFTQITPTSARGTWTAASRGRADIDQYLLRVSTNPNPDIGGTDFTVGGSVLTAVATGLTPGTLYYAKTFAHNADGYGPGSSVFTFQTPATDPPTVTASSTIAGTGATVVVTPSSPTGVTGYDIEWRPTSGTPTSTSTGSSPFSITGLTPGSPYEVRGRAKYPGTNTNWSSWVPFTTNNPNVSPGKYFDGSTAGTVDVTYSWAGTTNLSASIATGRGVASWVVSSAQGTQAVLQQITGGFSGTYAARSVFKADQTAVGWAVTQSGTPLTNLATVAASAPYVGSVYVRPSRAQSLRIGVQWLDATGTVIAGTAYSAAVLAQPNVWTRLTASGTSPATAAYGRVRIEDVAGTGWVLWKSGEFLDFDAAMITLLSLFDYFDGSTPASQQFSYEWTGTAHSSSSFRRTLPVTAYDPLQDPDCDPIPLPPAPPQIPADCIEEIGVWRRLLYRVPASNVTLFPDTVPTLYLMTLGAAARQARLRFYPNPLDLDPNLVDTSTWEAELILTYIPAHTTMTIDGVSQRAYALIDGEFQTRVANQLLYGTDGAPATWPVLRCGIGYVISLDAPSDAPVDNLTLAADLTERS